MKFFALVLIKYSFPHLCLGPVDDQTGGGAGPAVGHQDHSAGVRGPPGGPHVLPPVPQGPRGQHPLLQFPAEPWPTQQAPLQHLSQTTPQLL